MKHWRIRKNSPLDWARSILMALALVAAVSIDWVELIFGVFS